MTGIAGFTKKNSRRRAAIGLPVMAALVGAGYWSVRLVYADWLYRRNTPASLGRAVELDGGNARYQAWRAELEEYAGQDPGPALRRAVQLNPYASDVWMRLAAGAEAAGDFRAAESSFLKAAQVDRLFTPRWALMNFYFRRGNAAQFWLWTRRALEMSYGDLTPVFELCWRFSGDAARLRQALPDSGRAARQYLAFLIERKRWAAAAPVAGKLVERAQRADVPVLLRYCDGLLEDGQAASAAGIWNRLCARRLLPYRPGLANGDFAVPSIQHGFDWRLSANPEISILQPGPEGGVQVTFSGRQPEHAEVLWQWMSVQPDRAYRLAFQYQSSAWGVSWTVGQTRQSLPPNEPWRSAELRFTSGAASAVRLALVYQREPGAMRAEGTLRLRNLRLEFAE
jgi:tetratricopeptide (TPR) repeat protein